MTGRVRHWPLAALLILGLSFAATAAEPELPERAKAALKKATEFYRSRVASHGGYVYYYTPDLRERWGEGRADPETIFVQPPGTPTVGTAYLAAFAATGDSAYRDAVRETALALVAGQLQSGGWAQVIHFAKPERGRLGKYRKGSAGSWNVSSLDDDQTQAALLFLIQADRALDFKNAEIHEAVEFGLAALLRAQFAHGGFPQGWQEPNTAAPRVGRARLPTGDWRTEGKIKNYWQCATLNDGLVGRVAEVLIAAHRTYGEPKYQAALEKLGEFLILAQMPEPQPGWCQQYSDDMVPIWARKFEPPAITGWESQDAMRTLIRIAEHTRQPRFLEPIPPALAYFRKSLLADGRVARYYELGSNKPLYMDARYQLTDDDSAAPSHYGWKQPAHFDEIEAAYKRAQAALAAEPGKTKPSDAKPSDAKSSIPAARTAAELEPRVRKILDELDGEGRWISTYAGERLVGQPKFADGFRYLSSDVFSRNVRTLSEYLSAVRK